MGFLGQHRSQQSAAQLPQYTGLQLQTATNALPVPLVYGMQKLGMNVIYYDNFTPVPVFEPQQSSGKGGVFGGGGGSVTWQQTGWRYTADLELALCEGPIVDIGQVWSGQSTYLYRADSPNPNGFTLRAWDKPTSLFKGTATQTPWPHLPTSGSDTLGPDLAYARTAYLAGAAFDLGQSASLGTLNVEVAGLLYGTGANGVDADPALVVQDFLTDPHHGAGYPASALDLDWLLGGDGTSTMQAYCAALGIAFSPKIDQFETAASILTRWLQLANCAAVMSDGKLRIIPYGDMDIEGNGITFVAPVTVRYTLTDRDFVAQEDEDPVRVDRVDPLSLANIIRLEVLNRAGVNVAQALITRQQSETLAIMMAIADRGASPGSVTLPQPQGQPQYQATPVEARDLASILEMGAPRIGQTITAHEICDIAIGATVAQILLQRGLYVRATYQFSLHEGFIRLDPMDVVEAVDPVLGTVKLRLTSIEEEEESGELICEAELLTIGVSTPGPNVASGAIGSGENTAVESAPVQTVLIYEPPPLATDGAPEIWFGASGGEAGVADPNWGGCFVWASIDGGDSYARLTQISAPLRQGLLTADLAAASGWDTASTLSVDLTESGASLLSTTDANAQAAVSNLSLVDGELIAFATATLTAPHEYDLTRLQRGLYGTAPAAHLDGAGFEQLDRVARVPLPAQFVNAPVKFKFQSFNRFGGALQSLADCAEFDYTPNGVGYQGSTRLATLAEDIAASGSSLFSTIEIPADAYLLGVTVEITAAVSGPIAIAIDPEFTPSGGAGGTSGAFGSCGVTLGADHSYATAATLWSAASRIRLTPVGGSFSSGSISVSIRYLTVN
jgi:hypothetical protein